MSGLVVAPSPNEPANWSQELIIGGVDLGQRINEILLPTITMWMDLDLIKRNHSFGLAMASSPGASRNRPDWNNPDELIGWVTGWGPDTWMYIRNAARKVHMAGRIGGDSLPIARNMPEHFRDTDRPDGDFPYGGAVYCRGILLGVSALRQAEDDWVARAIAGMIATEIEKINPALLRWR